MVRNSVLYYLMSPRGHTLFLNSRNWQDIYSLFSSLLNPTKFETRQRLDYLFTYSQGLKSLTIALHTQSHLQLNCYTTIKNVAQYFWKLVKKQFSIGMRPKHTANTVTTRRGLDI